jgi:hypothetical protein
MDFFVSSSKFIQNIAVNMELLEDVFYGRPHNHPKDTQKSYCELADICLPFIYTHVY